MFILTCGLMQGQAQGNTGELNKKYNATRVEEAPKIDGILDDEVWRDVPVAANFVMLEPGDGDPIREGYETSVRVIYDDNAVYFAAYLRDRSPTRIIKQMTQRDNIGQSDFFLIDINTYNDGENQTRFIVTAAGTLADARMTGESEDYAYNVVWDAATSIDEDGWYVEIKIPYAALRFPEKEEQLWGIQFVREISHINETYVWNYVNKSIGKFTQYTGLLGGLRNIDPPVRLNFYPYSSFEVDNFNGLTQSNINAGMDIQYGITDGFTLDATLIPDFGQMAFDNVELNLTPFEQEFGENRAFFTEGTELFTKGNLFYSRRVGDAPIGFNDAQTTLLSSEVILENPELASLINAFKISGRTDRDLGIGFFNAITQEAQAILRDTITGEIRHVITEPLANYNIIVLDQQYNQNSSITLINTNVTRDGNVRDGNVSGFLFDIFNPSNSYNFTGEAKMSNVNHPGQRLTGFASTLGVRRTKGNIRYALNHDFANETYDINDLGLNFTNNYNNFYGETSYQIFEPTHLFNHYRVRLYSHHQRRYVPNLTARTAVGGNFFATTVNRFAFGGYFEISSPFRDFFEPRQEGNYIQYNENAVGDVWISSDYRKNFAIDARIGYQNFWDSNQDALKFSVSPRIRFSDKFIFVYSFGYDISQNRYSYVSRLGRNVLFGNRDMENLENSIQATYNFTTTHGLNLRFRNFYSVAPFEEGQFVVLHENGRLNPIDLIPARNPDAHFNIWNLDLSYRWQFAPGSEAILLYRNSIFNLDSQSELNYTQSLERLFMEPLRQNISLRIVYFIDYTTIRNLFRS